MNKRIKQGYRHLTEQEKKLITKNLKIMEDELEYKEKVTLARKQFAIDVAELEFRKQVKELEKGVKVLKVEVEEYKYSITELKRQLEEGVKIK